MKSESYIKLFRKMAEWEHYKDSNTVHVFLHLLIFAVGNDMDCHGKALKAGQYITSIRQIAESTGLTVKQVRRCISVLKESGEISAETINHEYTVYTVLNYAQYQGEKRGKSRKNSRPYDDAGSDAF